MADTIQDFLIGLGFKVDENSVAKFNRVMDGALKAANTLNVAMAAATASITASLSLIAKGFDDVSYAAGRTGTSIANLRGMGYAVSQLGGSFQGAVASMESFALKMRSNPGYERMVQSLGVMTRQNGKMRDTATIAEELAGKLSQKPSYVALQYLNELGIDEKTYNAMKSGEYRRFREEQREKVRLLGVDMEKTGKIGQELSRSWGSLGLTIDVLSSKFLQSLGPVLTDFIKKVDAFLTRNADTFVRFFERAAEFATKFMTAVEKLIEKGEGPLADFFNKLVKGADDWKSGMETLAKFLAGAWLASIAATFTAVAANWAALLVRLGPLGAAIAAGTGIWMAHEDTKAFNQKAESLFNPGGRNPFASIDEKAAREKPKDNRTWWQRRPQWMGGLPAPTAEPSSHVTRHGGGGRRNAFFTKENADAVRSAAAELGVSPEDLATVISYETGGRFDPSIRGGAGNRHIGLIQFGPREQDAHKASQDQTFPEQMRSVVDYLKKRGVKPGMGLLDLYSTINAGAPGLYNRSDAGNGGAPGTVADKVQTMAPHAARGRLFLRSGATPYLIPYDQFSKIDAGVWERAAANANAFQSRVAGPMLMPSNTTNNSSSLNAPQNITMTINAPSGNAEEIGRSVSSNLDSSNERFVRNMKGSFR